MKLSMSSMSSSSSRPPTPFSSSQMREMSFVRDAVGPLISRSSSEDSTTDLRLEADATGGELESRPRLKRVSLFLLRVKVSPVFSSIKLNSTDLADDDAFYAFYAFASSHLHHPESLLPPRPRRQ